jgi:alpha-galactosidase/6-phospho-beta-glucosidase family protein
VEHARAYEELAIAAARSGDRAIALRALLANQLVGQHPQAAQLLEAAPALLPRFFRGA